jgi:dTDP-4-amino-4,6-dideoxygalactose transaminase
MDEELLADPDAIRACLGSDVLACIFAHLGGRIADVAGLRAEAARHGVAWIDDHCQSFTPELALDVNSMTVFSFGLGKNLMATAGGALVSPLLAEDCARAAAAMDREPSRHARVRFAVSLLRFYAWRLWPALAARLVRLGSMTSQYGYRLMSRRDAALLGAQLDSAGSILAGRRRNARVMLDALQSDAVLTQAGAGHVYTKLSFIFGTPEARERFFEVMGRQGIEYEPMYVPLHMRMGEACVSTRIAPLCERMYRNVFNVPVRPNLTPRELRRVKNAIGKL